MKIGDKVRFTHGTEQGIIRRLIDERTLEVEIDDGFLIPILKKEVVLIASEESTRFVRGGESTKEFEAIEKGTGIFLAFDAFNDRVYSVMLVNDTANTILYTYSERSSIGYKGIGAGSIQKYSTVKLTEFRLDEFEHWPEVYIQLLQFRSGMGEHLTPLEKKIKFTAAAFHKSKKATPLLNRPTFLFQLDKDAIKIEAHKILEKIDSNTNTTSTSAIEKPASEVDLHIEKLIKDHQAMTPMEMLHFQINHFEKCLENALATDMHEIVFIHGSGNGTLKTEIQKRLSRNKQIKFFQDARKDKFGYGATLVGLK